MEKINNGSVLLGKYLVERWAREPKNKEGYLVIKDFDKLCEDFNKWLNENYPNTDLEKEFKGDVFEEKHYVELIKDVILELKVRGLI